MEKLGLNEIREKFLSFFESKEHLRLPSFSLVPNNDNSLLIINSGMAPLKRYFTGEEVPPRYRVTTCQKCIRTPDIERVGKTARHGTYFEMLGNFSFGNYFKHEATAWAWEFITKVLEIPTDRLWVTIYEDDDETRDIWVNEVGVSPDRIVRLGKEDNFWEIGLGPCGPCSEIYFDRGEKYGCGKPTCGVGCDCDRYVEFWNLVFSQFDHTADGGYLPLKKKNIDTGMGLERIACIMQGVDNLFEVDTVKNIMQRICEIAGVKYKTDEKTDVALRVITDHIRSTTMMVSDGIMPSNEGRGYVLRRLLRRAARYGRVLGIEGNFLYKVCDTVIEENKQAYPELVEKADYIKKIIKIEEERFQKTIDTGMAKLYEKIDELKKSGASVMSGEDTFKLSDTYGFPVDLTLEILEENGMTLDREKYDGLMQQQRERAREAREKLGDFAWAGENTAIENIQSTEFVGYTEFQCKAKIEALICDGERCETAAYGDVVAILDRTPFYAQSGGQVGDKGTIETGGCVLKVEDVKKTQNGVFLHICRVEKGVVSVGDEVNATVDIANRRAIMRAHSATHMLQSALRTVLGNHVQQAGSLVEPDRLRFDFTHFSALSTDELKQVENLVNQIILEDLPVNIKSMPIDDAKKLGAMALFGEKYGDIVRVVSMGDKSVELCGGTHIENTARAGSFRISSECSVASGVRRIEAVVGIEVLKNANEERELISRISDTLKTTPTELLRRAEQINTEMHTMRQKIGELKNKAIKLDLDTVLDKTEDVNGIRVAVAGFKDMTSEDLRTMCDMAKRDDLICVFASATDGKVNFAACCGENAVEKGAHAGNILKQAAAVTGGGGGGRADSATAGGKDVPLIQKAMLTAKEVIAQMLSKSGE